MRAVGVVGVVGVVVVAVLVSALWCSVPSSSSRRELLLSPDQDRSPAQSTAPLPVCLVPALVLQTKAIRRFVITAFSWLKAFKTLSRHYAKRALTRLFLMTFASRPNFNVMFHVERPWGQRPFSIVS